MKIKINKKEILEAFTSNDYNNSNLPDLTKIHEIQPENTQEKLARLAKEFSEAHK